MCAEPPFAFVVTVASAGLSLLTLAGWLFREPPAAATISGTLSSEPAKSTDCDCLVASFACC